MGLRFARNNHRYFCEKKTVVRKPIVIFEAFLTLFSMVSIKNTFEYFFMQKKNRKKHVKTPKNHVFCIFLGGNWPFFKIEFKYSIEFLKNFYMPFSNLENSYYF